MLRPKTISLAVHFSSYQWNLIIRCHNGMSPGWVWGSGKFKENVGNVDLCVLCSALSALSDTRVAVHDSTFHLFDVTGKQRCLAASYSRWSVAASILCVSCVLVRSCVVFTVIVSASYIFFVFPWFLCFPSCVLVRSCAVVSVTNFVNFMFSIP